MVSKCIFHVQYRPPSFTKTCINIEHVFSRSYVGFNFQEKKENGSFCISVSGLHGMTGRQWK